ncbi:glycosyltransferase family 2 protein [Candidatus Pelagibacter sp.]|nr:glycosyltransferase family 2 protein [Candidatus Pelagibacter sp.]
MPKFIILIPSYNERKTLIKVIKKLHKFKIQIIDDCSQDNTNKAVKFFKNVSLYRNKINIGYEQSLNKGFKLLGNSNFDFIITMDADGEHSVKNVPKIIKFCNRYNPDLVIGNRHKKNRLIEIILSFFFKLRFDIRDPLSGFKAYKIKKLNLILKKNKIKKYFLVDLLKNFIKSKMKIMTINIKSINDFRRKPRVGGNLYVNSKMLLCFKFIF